MIRKRKHSAILFLAIALFMTGCGKESPAKPTPTPFPTEEVTVTPERKPETEYYAGSFGYQYSNENARAWFCNGILQFEKATAGHSEGNVWKNNDILSVYTVNNAEGLELFRVTKQKNDNGITEYRLQAGNVEKTLQTVSASEPFFEVFTYQNRTVLFQNGSCLLTIASKKDSFTLAFSTEGGAQILEFPVRSFVAQPIEAEAGIYVPESRILTSKTTLKDIYDGTYLNGILEQAVSALPHEEWEDDYVQYVSMKLTKDYRTAEYSTYYQQNSIMVTRNNWGVITEYDFKDLSEGTAYVEYYTFEGNMEQLTRTFETEEVDRFRTDLYEKEQTLQNEKDALRNALIPVSLERTDFGYVERGIANEGGREDNYVRFLYDANSIEGDVISEYDRETGAPVIVMVDSLGESGGRYYADGRIVPGENGPERHITRRSYDAYGVMIQEQDETYTRVYTYEFNGFSYGGEDDTVRHEWTRLMPYLEDEVNSTPEPKDETDTPDEGDNPNGETQD